KHIDELTDTYRPLATYPGELDAWRELKWESSHVPGPLAKVLALSRADRDAEAMAEMRVLEYEYDHIHNALRKLNAVNHAAALQSGHRIRRLQRFASGVQAGLVVGGIAFTAVVGVFAVRLMRQRERQVHDYSRRLEEKNRELDAFAGRVAHDLRSPL